MRSRKRHSRRGRSPRRCYRHAPSVDYHERQRGLFCGLHAINNLFGGPRVMHDDFVVVARGFPGAYDARGNYTLDLVHAVLKRLGCHVVDNRTLHPQTLAPVHGPWQGLAAHVAFLRTPPHGYVGCIVALPGHYVALKRLKSGEYLLIDSLQTTTERVLDLSARLAHARSLLHVTNESSE